ncbi:hypothetical protein ACJX0J_036200, partial [Zea mays]
LTKNSAATSILLFVFTSCIILLKHKELQAGLYMIAGGTQRLLPVFTYLCFFVLRTAIFESRLYMYAMAFHFLKRLCIIEATAL